LRLLVSVRAADEVIAALTGGADIIDAKEPKRGSLGPVAPEVLRRILQEIPDDCPASVALGDVATTAEIVNAIQRLPLSRRSSSLYLKLGFAGVRSSDQVRHLLEAAVSLCSRIPGLARLVAVAYADFERAGSLAPPLISDLATEIGAAGVLLDTQLKDGRGLLNWLSADGLADWVTTAREYGLMTAISGSLQAADLPLACGARPDIIGIRGAACTGGRGGRVSQDRVRRFREALAWAALPLAGSAVRPGWRNAGTEGNFSLSD
jgi:(5-formylfuran-3-yl)methyl phosphate synthase